ncbi:MAG TPA: alpha/beta hydrolase [Chlorobaculum sp.]|jgi:pimeloyl-ACP methyl ester carboxylesterase|uniref:Epoxide hydrolase, putative n=1 Tax=Chlorobaculum tepidum (strain ATCC 49652 / DSM 12025 / NBRC 103806 / TLS) TaxID=194439 RepID=Q8KEH2_CHLTE|nr:alpha/beta hydrolase [Chlorobaculum tepidum]AAM71954.1 epoxide hydrolase, putative [Chlorobaculum tepidum TLS]HBU22874.1 alpha/beta hydrolase [Chlorobaculum sp.]
MDNVPEPSSEKFRAYRQKLLDQLETSSQGERHRAQYELELMRNSHFVKVGGLLHHYHDSGPENPRGTVLLIHGWDCWWMWWHRIIRELNAAGYRTVAYDMKGHGWSENDPENRYQIADFVRDLDELIRAIGLKDLHIAAFSFGPFVALDYVNTYPNSVRSMVFFNFGYLPNSEFISKVAPATIIFIFNIMMRKLTWWLPAYIFARLVLSRNSVMMHDIKVGFESLGFCASEAIEQTAQQITAMETTQMLPDMVRAVRVPILFAAGEGDVIMTCENARKLQEMTPSGSYLCVPDCGHLITLELPQTAAEIVLQHISSNS